ncbi:MAG: cysteine--tRNA ligase [Candidatus Levybacteria bacterium]|nr:cysteine--tRNA ligase [Candidatus Levybacteria bacterium]
MMLKIYNTLTRKIEEFKPLKGKTVGIYSCGPTVYWNQHIGHMYAFVQWDILVRFLRSTGYKVKWVMNITDVGHLTSDEDAGEDKMEKGAKREGLTVWEVAQKYLDQFLESIDLMNIKRPDVMPRATDHIAEQIELIKKIEANGFTYKTKTGVVFDTSKFPDYDKFAKLNLEDLKSGARVEIDPEKRQPWDFLLWVTNQPHHIMQWDSPWGRGFPGWHIECTAMSTKYLGEKFDIHTGGKEHVSVHHTNEIAQAYGAFGRQTANYWLHNEWLTLKGEKVSKSSGNFVLVSDLKKRGFRPMHLRYLFLNSNYRTGLDFSWESLEGAKIAYERLVEIVRELQDEEAKIGCSELERRFIDALNDDLNTSVALAVVWELLKSDYPKSAKLESLYKMDEVLGLNLKEVQAKEPVEIPEEIQKMAKEREELRKQKRFHLADQLRNKIKKLGFDIQDTDDGKTEIKKI